jgi:type II secretory pathway pseudopilin PulG
MKKASGQLLIESIVAITVIAIAILGIFTLSSRSVSLNRVVSDQYTATYLAAEGIEVVKNIIDTNVVHNCVGWNTGINLSNEDFNVNYDTADSSATDSSLALQKFSENSEPLYFENGLYNNKGNGKRTKFYRKVRLEYAPNQRSVNIISTVEWANKGNAEFEVVLEDVFYDWRPFADNCQ